MARIDKYIFPIFVKKDFYEKQIEERLKLPTKELKLIGAVLFFISILVSLKGSIRYSYTGEGSFLFSQFLKMFICLIAIFSGILLFIVCLLSIEFKKDKKYYNSDNLNKFYKSNKEIEGTYVVLTEQEVDDKGHHSISHSYCFYDENGEEYPLYLKVDDLYKDFVPIWCKAYLYEGKVLIYELNHAIQRFRNGEEFVAYINKYIKKRE